MKILLIDDQPKLFADMLALYGYEVDVATDGYIGAQKLFNPQRHYDLLILDLDMPMLDGWSVLKLVRENTDTAELPVIILTCHDTEEFLVKGLRRGADAYLIKPITPQRMLAHIEAVTRRLPKDGVDSGSDTEAEPETTPDELANLTRRENEILRLLIKGLSNQQIAEHLVISETTVKNHLAHIFRKLGVTNRTQAAYLAHKLNL